MNARNASTKLRARRDEDRADRGDRGDHLRSEDLTRLTTRSTEADHIDQIGLVTDQTNIDQTIKVTGLGLTGGTIALLATGVTGVVFFVSTLPAMLVIDKVGRKPMLLVGSLVMLTSMVITGIIVAKFRHDWVHHANAGWTAVVFIWIYVGAFGATWGPVSWTLVSEIFPLSIRAKGASIGASSNWINNFAIAFFVPPMLAAWAWGTYIFFAAFLACGVVWVHFMLPETKGASLEDMDRVFNSHRGETDAAILAEARRELGLDGGHEDDIAMGQRSAQQKDGTVLKLEKPEDARGNEPL